MHNVVISDTSVLIIFKKIEEFELLKNVYNSIVTTPEIVQEFKDPLPEWVKIQSVKDIKYLEFLKTQIDEGEASALALAQELESPLLLLDDLKARKLAKKLNFRFTGTLGIINKAKQLGILKEIKPVIEKLLNTDFRIAKNIINELLIRNNEK